MRFNDKGSDVRALQEALLARGYALPKYGADGHLGGESWDALQAFAKDKGILWNPEVPPAVVSALDEPEEPPVVLPPPEPDVELDGVRVLDLRDSQPNPPPPVNGKNKWKIGSNGKVVERAVSAVTGITIHQTAVKFGAKKADKERWPDDPERALAERAKGVACHVMAFHDGFVAWPNPLSWLVYHGNAFNDFELGIEIDGSYPGLESKRTSDHTEVTAEVIRAARAGIKLLVTEGRKLGMPIEYIHAHRQSSDTRRGDPGEALWKAVVLDYAVPVLGLKTEPGKTWRDGYKIPTDWDPDGVGKY